MLKIHVCSKRFIACRSSPFSPPGGFAPLCLCVVAGLHLFRVWTCDQTPWKGGGFGMFSTVDDESARFARCYLVTESGDLPLPIPPAANKLLAELRAAPTQHKLNELARRLAAQSWRCAATVSGPKSRP